MAVDIDDLEKSGLELLIVNTSEFISEVVSIYLHGLQKKNDILFFGCGRTSELLVEQYADCLKPHNIHFVTSFSRRGESFRGYPLLSLSDISEKKFHCVVILSKNYEKEMLQAIKHIPRQKVLTLSQIVKSVDCRRIIIKARDYIEHTVLQDDIRKINGIIQRIGKMVCFTTINPSHNFLKIMLSIKKQGYGVLLVLNNDIINNAFSMDRFRGGGYYDYMYVTKYSYCLELLQILRSCRVSFVHAVASMAESISLAYVIANSPCPVVVEYCDVKQLVFEGNDELARTQLGLTFLDYEVEKKAQKIVYTRSRGVIIKDSPEIIEHLEMKYGMRPNWLHFFPYLCNEFVVSAPTEKKYSKESGKIHIAYAGCLHNNPEWHPTPIFRSTLRAIEQLSRQEIYFSIYNAMDSTGRGFEEYLEIAEKNEFFDYHFALPYDQITPVLSRYDLGWFCFDFSGALESSIFHKTTFGSKVFTYIEAGLPILISPEQAYMCSVVEGLGVGRAVRFNEINNLADIIKTMDMEQYASNIQLAREEMALDKHIPKLIKFYRETGFDALS